MRDVQVVLQVIEPVRANFTDLHPIRANPGDEVLLHVGQRARQQELRAIFKIPIELAEHEKCRQMVGEKVIVPFPE